MSGVLAVVVAQLCSSYVQCCTHIAHILIWEGDGDGRGVDGDGHGVSVVDGDEDGGLKRIGWGYIASFDSSIGSANDRWITMPMP